MMKKHDSLLLFIGVICGMWFCVLHVSAQTTNSLVLNILHTNDTHSCIEPINKNLVDTLQADKAGFIRRAVFVERQREKDKDLLLFDCGDFSQGSAYYNLYKGEVEIKLMNHMKYDACTIGNHEFDFGLENMARLFQMAEFPVVCCNYDFSGTVLAEWVKPYVVLQRKGLRVGVFGVSPMLEGLVPKQNYEGVKYEEPIEAARRVVKKLREEEKCDVVICLSHLGWNMPGVSDEEIIKNTTGLDVVLGGHSHTYFKDPEYVENADDLHVACYQMGKNGRFVGSLSLEFRVKE